MSWRGSIRASPRASWSSPAARAPRLARPSSRNPASVGCRSHSAPPSCSPGSKRCSLSRAVGLDEAEREAVAGPPLALLRRRAGLRVPVARIVRIAQEVALAVEAEPGLLHLVPHHALVDPVQRLGFGEAGAVLCARIDHHVDAAGPERA